MSEPIAVYLGSVNRWECDENDHLNVRFFSQKMIQTLELGLIELGCIPREDVQTITANIKSQHMRFIAEARIAVPITGYFGLLSADDTGFCALVELRNSGTDQVMSAFVFDVNYPLKAEGLKTVPLPNYAGSRGVPADPFPYANLTLSESYRRGFITIGRGIIQPDECSPNGLLLPNNYMSRGSDSMPNLWTRFAAGDSQFERGQGVIGGAVLEYRMDHFTNLKQGDRFVVVSGLDNLTEKIQHMVHIFFNIDSGEITLGCRALGISMDLVARKSIPIPPERRAVMQKFMIKP
ncbi:MAG: hypothetical protein ABGY96_30275 [bacterium]|nr:hypothetical protein [Gammaproteobacteria bacterium]HIL94347.1 hypothetical protein [Pseudomonadales bacterium]